MEQSLFAPAPPSTPLRELLESLQQQRSTCVVHVTDRFFAGQLHVADGTVDAAEFGALRGAAAVSAMMITDDLDCMVVYAEPPSHPLPSQDIHLPIDSELATFGTKAELEAGGIALPFLPSGRSDVSPEAAPSEPRAQDRPGEPPPGELAPPRGESLPAPPLALPVPQQREPLSESRESSPGFREPPPLRSKGAPGLEQLARPATSSEGPTGLGTDPVHEAPGQATLRGLGNSLRLETSPHAARHEILPEPISGSDPPETHDLDRWAARTARGHDSASSPRSGVDSFGLSFGEEATAVAAQRSMIPAMFSPERISPVWVVVALCAPLLLAGMFWGAQSDRVIPPKPVVASKEAILPPSLAAGTAPAVKTGGLAPTVLLRVLVAEDGKVKTASVQAPRPGLGTFEKQAIETVRGYRFRPATQGGRPVEQWVTLPLSFLSAPGPREFTVKGSDTIGASLGSAWARSFEAKEQGLRIHVEALGSSTAFVGLLDGSAAVGLSSRPIREAERAFAERLGVQLREVVGAYDGVAVIVHPNNPLRSLDLKSVARIFSQQTKRWSELAGADAPIRTIGRPSYSGTHVFFQERLLAAHGPGAAFGPSVESIEASKEIAARVAADVNAIGYVGVGYLDSGVRALSISADAGTPAVSATPVAIRDGSYPIARPLYIYLRADSEHDARAWVDHALSSDGQAIVTSSGFVPLNSPLVGALAAEVAAPHVAAPEITRVYFDPSSAVVEPDSRTELMAAAAALRAGKRALVIGHADSAGTAEANELLAHQRAQAVAAQLRLYGSKAAAIEVEVAAASHPLASNASADGRRANRRVDIIVQGR